MALAILFLAFMPIYALSETYTPEMTISPDTILTTSNTTTFNIAYPSIETASFPNILLVTTVTSLSALTDPITVNWTGGSTSFEKINFQLATETDGYIPSPMATSFDTGRYTLTELKQKMGLNDTALYFVFGYFLSKPVSQTSQQFNVTFPSENPYALVLAVARTFGSTSFNIRCSLMPIPIPEISLSIPALVLVSVIVLIETYTVIRLRRHGPKP